MVKAFSGSLRFWGFGQVHLLTRKRIHWHRFHKGQNILGGGSYSITILCFYFRSTPRLCFLSQIISLGCYSPFQIKVDQIIIFLVYYLFSPPTRTHTPVYQVRVCLLPDLLLTRKQLSPFKRARANVALTGSSSPQFPVGGDGEIGRGGNSIFNCKI